MQVRSISVINSPARPDHVRLCAQVEYDTAGLQPELYWFEVHQKYREFLSSSGNPWLLCLAPVAITLGESLRLKEPVDRALLKGVRELVRIWSFWFPNLKAVPIMAAIDEDANHEKNKKILSFFSGGVDAFFTAVHHSQTQDPHDQIAIDDLVNVWGFDIPYSNREGYFKIERSLKRAADLLGKELFLVATNLRETQLKNCEWEYLYHGPALASVAHVLEKRYSQALIASTGGYRETFPQGSHPALMPFLSSGGLQIMQSGGVFSREKKIERISSSEAARESLHVCFHLGNEQNCGHCLKCCRTMLTLDLFGVLDKFKTFDLSKYNSSRAQKMFLWNDDDKSHAMRIRDLAVQKNRQDIAQAMDKSIRQTWRIKKLLAALSWFKKFPGGKKLYQRVESQVFRDLVGGEERYYLPAKDAPFFQFSQA